MPVQGLTKEQIAAATAAVVASGGKSTDRDNRLPGETGTEANARITQGYKDQTKPELTQQGIAAKATIQFVREGAGGVGTYKEVYGIGTPIPETRTTEYGNTYDAQGNLIYGSGKKIKVDPSTLAVKGTKIFQMLGGILYYDGLPFTGVEGGKTYKDGIEDTTVNNENNNNPTGKKEVSRKANGDGTFTVTYDDKTTEIIGTKRVITNTNTTDDSAANAALQAQIDALIAAGKLADAKRLEDKARFDAEIKAQAAASKLAYDTAAQDKADAIKVERVSGYQTLKTEFEKYGLGSLVESVEALILNGTPKSEATLKLRATPQYQLRFAGNTARLAAGKNLYDESTYLALENDFQTSFEAYGQKALLGNTRESAQAMFAEYIGSDKSPTEIKDRIRLAVDEVSNRKDIRAEFQKFFPEITDSDLVSYFLKPKETLSTLNAKVRVAQIGSAASAQGLNASLTTATDLEQLGLTEQQARTGYQRVATDLPTIEKLGNIDKTDIGQTTAENAYLKGLASEQRKIDKAAERERNRYAQSSGMNKVSLTDTKVAGLI